MTKTDALQSRQINHKTMRQIVGGIALFLAFFTYWLSDVYWPVNSISATYWTNSGDLFVGSLIVVGFFLAAYNGKHGRDLEYYISKVAAVLAVFVALFPTDIECTADQVTTGQACPVFAPSTWIDAITGFLGTSADVIHYVAAIPLFICLVVLLWFFSKRAKEKGHPGRALAYRILAIAMIAGMAIIYGIVHFWLVRSDAIFWVEGWALMTFGIAWLLAGSYTSDPELSSVGST
ncbi:MAG: hypothetical protein JJ850_01255 [Kordiimonadaceae bacterium]|nr:hypothetical protein [Kordiimonadaceae bacterium]MBO6567572.1 hypothetical protein [Kordiimonadaceae bacterium]MBO6963214.1 hypothetical protein [Kordiimonadaceae bacterium]